MLSVILASYQEKDNIIIFIQKLLRYCPDGQDMEIIIVDDDSKDGTIQAIQELDLLQVKLIVRTKTKGLASAFHRGILESRGEYVVWLDCDGSHPADLIPIMYEKMIHGEYDAVIASRYVEGGEDCRKFGRVFSSKLINYFAQWFLGFQIKDYTSGMILVRREVFDVVTFIPLGYGEYFIELVYNMQKKNLKITEIAYSFYDRNTGESKTASDWFGFLIHGFFYFLRVIQAKYRLRK